MYIYGGYDIREGPMSSMWSFDLNKVGSLDINTQQLQWNQVVPQGVKKPGKQLKPLEILNLTIGAISNHTSVVYNRKMYLYGGSTSLNTNATLFGYETQSNLWELIRVRAADNN